MEEEEDELECAVNLESFPLSRGSHECVAAWSLVSLQEDNSEKKSFLMAHTTANQSLSFAFLPNPKSLHIQAPKSPPREAPQILQESNPRHQKHGAGSGGGAKIQTLERGAARNSAAFRRQSNRRRSPGIQKPNPTTGEADVERGRGGDYQRGQRRRL
jgi:hypothetical protein